MVLSDASQRNGVIRLMGLFFACTRLRSEVTLCNGQG